MHPSGNLQGWCSPRTADPVGIPAARPPQAEVTAEGQW